MTKSVYLVEDEDGIALAVGFLLSKIDCSVRRIADGAEALEAIEQNPPDLVILDVMIPGRSGYEICQSIRQNPELSDLKVLMLTAKGAEVERRKAMALGADAFLTKPFSNDELQANIERLLLGEGA